MLPIIPPSANIHATKWCRHIDVAKKLAEILDTTVGYLLGEKDEANLFKDPAILKPFQDISVLPEKERECLLTTVDYYIKSTKIDAI